MKKVLVIGLILVSLLTLGFTTNKPEKKTVYGVYLPYSFTIQDLYK